VKLRTLVSPIRLSLGVASKRLRFSAAALSLQTLVAYKKLVVDIGEFFLLLTKQDTAIASESNTVRFEKVISELGFVAENIAFKFTRSFVDRSIFSDGEQYFAEDYVEGAPLAQTYTEPSQVFKRVGKVLVNSSEASDAPPVRVFEKVLGHTVGATDDLNGVVPGDDQTISFFKSLDQTFQAAEDFVRRVTYIRAFSDNFSTSDTDTLVVSKILQDASQTSDSGSLRMQSYTEDMTYFAEDYVGTTRTF
jgi:hypothetical protein